jgi:hypothetical protein
VKAVPLAPQQYTIYSMARVLLCIEQWETNFQRPIEIDRLMLFDFVIQYPREVSRILPNLKLTLEAEDLLEVDLSDLFAKRNSENMYEKFNAVLSALTARDLIKQILPTENDGNLYLSLTSLGNEKVKLFLSPVSYAIRDISKVLIENWTRTNPNKLLSEVFSLLPDQSEAVQQLATPFEIWQND